MLLRILLAISIGLIAEATASAHPHVWVKMKSELLYAADGSITGVRHHWAFDDMFSAFALQGIESKEKGKYTRAELAPLARTNIESLKEYGYFTFATADGKKAEFNDPLPDYWLDFKEDGLTLNFTLPFKTPVKAKNLNIDIYDPTIFVDFAFAKEQPLQAAGAPPNCKIVVQWPREMTFAEGKALSEIPADEPNLTMAWGAQFANKIIVTCP